MQTFFTTTGSVTEHAQYLDNKRLHKQALEAWQILMTLTELDPEGNYREPKGWKHHPAVIMWAGREYALTQYAISMVDEWERRGFKSSLRFKILRTWMKYVGNRHADINYGSPKWMHPEVFPDIVTTHRQALLVKNYSWYSQWNWQEDIGVEPTEYTYLWPI
jgi:hypothetical protein